MEDMQDDFIGITVYGLHFVDDDGKFISVHVYEGGDYRGYSSPVAPPDPFNSALEGGDKIVLTQVVHGDIENRYFAYKYVGEMSGAKAIRASDGATTNSIPVVVRALLDNSERLYEHIKGLMARSAQEGPIVDSRVLDLTVSDEVHQEISGIPATLH